MELVSKQQSSKGEITPTENCWSSELRGLSIGLTTLSLKKKLCYRTVTKRPGARPTKHLTLRSQIQKESKQPNILRTRKPLRIGTWNVRTMYKAGKCANVARKMKNYQLEYQPTGYIRDKMNRSWKMHLNIKRNHHILW